MAGDENKIIPKMANQLFYQISHKTQQWKTEIAASLCAIGYLRPLKRFRQGPLRPFWPHSSGSVLILVALPTP